MEPSGQDDFEHLFRAHYKAVRRYLDQRVYESHLADDLCADVFEMALVSFGAFDPGRGTVRQWLIGIARHRLLRLWQAAARTRDAHARLAGLEAALCDETDIERAEWRAMAEALYRELDGLQGAYRTVLELRFLEGRTYEQIAALLGCTPVTARVRVHRGLAILRTRLVVE